MSSALEQQRAAAALILNAISGDDFALAGSGAIREHGVSGRPTRDIDLFTNNTDTDRIAAAVERAINTLTEHGYQALTARSAAQYARLAVTASDGYQFEVDLGVDWRAHEPVWLEVGPVLALEDAVANKVGALYSRAAARDYFDVDAIRQSRRFTDDELLQLAAEHDPGFDLALFAEQLGHVGVLRASTLAEYGVSPDQVKALQQRLETSSRHGDSRSCSVTLRSRPTPPSIRRSATRPGPTPATNHHDPSTSHRAASRSEPSDEWQVDIDHRQERTFKGRQRSSPLRRGHTPDGHGLTSAQQVAEACGCCQSVPITRRA